MIIFPAIDLKQGKCVRLRQGKANEQTIYFENPLDAARFLAEQGATWLHVVDLDGAFAGVPKNLELIADICQQIGLKVQLGGGIRSKSIAQKYLEVGVNRLIIGTMALEEPDRFEELVSEFGEKIGVSLDAQDGKLKTRGWVKEVNQELEDVIQWLNGLSLGFLIYTDIARDGMQTGVNLAMLKKVVSMSKMPVLAAGGINCLDDIKKLYPLSAQGLEGVITGRAVYEKTLDLAKALTWIKEQK